MRKTILLKIGGSVCTEKSKGAFKVRKKTVERIGVEISEARSVKEFRLILVTGAGPFGHSNVTDYDISEGLVTPRDYEGFAKTVSDCGYEGFLISEYLRRKGVLVYPYPSSSVIIQSNKKLVSFYLDTIRKLWHMNEDIVPVMNGTMVPDITIKGSIISGDRVITHLAERMRIKRIIFATDVDGIFSKDPHKDKNAKLIEMITKSNYKEIESGITGSSNTDVTGGMLGKVKKLLGTDTETLIINGNIPGRIKSALIGNDVKGTIIKP